MTGFKITPDDLRGSSSTLGTLGDQLTTGGQKLSTVGQNLVSHAKSDKSGVGSILAKALGTGTEVAGKVFTEGGRVAGAAGKRLHTNADSHESNEEHQTSVFKGITSDGKDEGSKPRSVPSSSDGSTKSSSSDDGPSVQIPKGVGGNRPKDPDSTSTSSDNRYCENDPVDIVSGEVVLVQRDVELLGPLPLVVERTHVSSYRAGHWFGPSWSSTLDERLEVDAEGVCYFAADGMILVYPMPAPGAPVLSTAGPRWPLAADPDGSLRISNTATGQELSFAVTPGSGPGVLPLRSVVGADGDQLDIERDQQGAPVLLTHSAGYQVAVDVQDGRVRELRVLDPTADPATAAASTPGVPVTRYGYDDLGRLTEVTNSSGIPSRYDYDQAGRLTGWQDRTATWYRYGYDENGRCVSTAGAGGMFDGVFAYDLKRRTTTFTDGLGRTSVYEFDRRYHLVRTTNPLGEVVQLGWDKVGQLVSRTDPLGRVTGYLYAEDGTLTTVLRPDGSRAEIGRSADAPLTVSIESEGVRWTREYDQDQCPDPLEDPVGVATELPYQSLGARADSGEPASAPAGQSGPARLDGAAGPSQVRDQFGRVRVRVDATGAKTLLGWTVEGGMAWRVNPLGGRDQWKHDPDGRQLEHLDPLGRITRREYGPFGLLTAVIDADGARTGYQYDTQARLTAVTNPQGQTWRYSYDPAGRIVEETDYDGRTLRFAYDAAGQLIRSVNGAGEQTEFAYDVLGNLAERRTPTATSSYEYDPVGRLVGATGADAVLRYERDEEGRVVAQTVNGATTVFEYAEDGSVRRRTPSGVESVWTYDGNGNGATLTTAGHTIAVHHDAADREVERTLDETVVLAQSFDPDDRLTEQTIGGAVAERDPLRRYHYQPDGRLSGIDDAVTGPVRFTVDRSARVAEVTGQLGRELYRYDALGNITHAAATGGRVPEHGDRHYDRNTLTGAGAVQYRHDAQGRLVSREQSGAGTWHYQWDALDRLVAVVTPDGGRWRYRYDPLGRRIAKQRVAAWPGSTEPEVVEQVDFVWDGPLLIEQRHSGAGGPDRVITWDYQPGEDRPVAQTEHSVPTAPGTPDQDQRFYTVVTDHLGTPIELLDTQGVPAWHGRTDLWGVSLPAPRAGGYTPLRFPGQYHDTETGLHYNVFRYYDPATGRYASQDPLGLGPAVNPIAYVDNPLQAVDPLGLAPKRGASDCDLDLDGSAPNRAGGSTDPSSVAGTSSASNKKQKLSSDDERQKYQENNADEYPGYDNVDPTTGRTTWQGGSTDSGQYHFSAGSGLTGGSTPKKNHLTDTEDLNKLVDKKAGKNDLSQPLKDELNAAGSDPYQKFVKGHLMNDNLGGQGEADNMTTLSTKANGAHKNVVETPIKNVVGKINSPTKHVSGPYQGVGVSYQVKASAGTKFPNSPNPAETSIRQNIQIHAQYTGLNATSAQNLKNAGQSLPALPPPGTTMDTISGRFTTPTGQPWTIDDQRNGVDLDSIINGG
ncbi:MAG TPA: RHS repeat-associated core domain-containing protein [Pseudonocardiaceae bacterium]|jgi:RHS repeat-associated protein|nr:RHS repeat-associated core domain-containing protein [Pseudonocardiaceae bacterium]